VTLSRLLLSLKHKYAAEVVARWEKAMNAILGEMMSDIMTAQEAGG